MYSEPFPGWSSKLFTSVPTGRAPSGYASPSLAETAKSIVVLYHFAKSRLFPVVMSYLPAMRPMTPDDLMTSPGCIFSVAMIHLFRLPPATSAMSADLKTQMFEKINTFKK